MKILSSWWRRGLLLLGICGIGAGLAGCGSLSSDEPTFSDAPPGVTASGSVAVPPSTPGVATPATGVVRGVIFRVGDLVTVNYSGIEPPLAPNEERIREDGSITLPMIGSVLAVGKTAGDLQKEIQALYVPKYYLRLLVTVKAPLQAYYVGGEVKNSGSREWFGKVKLTQAIQAAGDFTDYANRKKVQIIRADGTRIIVNCKEASTHPELDPDILPGDTITVPRSIW